MEQTTVIRERLGALRCWMEEHGLDAFIVPSNDPHFSEYVAPHWQSRAWLSGFDGSAGTVIVTAGSAALWTDSRYFLQAGSQLTGTGIELQRQGMPGTPTRTGWLTQQLPKGAVVGIDAQLISCSDYYDMEEELEGNSLELRACDDPFAEIWDARPPRPDAPATLLHIRYSGESAAEKLARIRAENPSPETVRLVCVLDEIAWALNIRGRDIEYNPLVIGYLSIEPERAVLFADPDKFTPADRTYLRTEAGVEIVPYDTFSDYLSSLHYRHIIINPSFFDYGHYCLLSDCKATVHQEVTPFRSAIYRMKAVKNPTETRGFRRAMEEDGVALVRFEMWLEKEIEQGRKPTELEIAARLRGFRSMETDYRGDSFGAIVGFGEHGAFVHYQATTESSLPVDTSNFLLIDSGGQYLYGTTDITRTYHFGDPTPQQKADYTAVLKGMIDLSAVLFPDGTRGAQLDVLARRHLWQQGQNYGHGTGHGIGHYLCVHEGPQSVRMEENPVKIEPGMVQSIEPGLYLPGEYGIRIENLVLTVRSPHPGFLAFETLTLCPIDLRPLDTAALEPSQKEWLDTYHRTVYERLAPHLTPEEQVWLQEKTLPIG